jgi:hypothetical protein
VRIAKVNDRCPRRSDATGIVPVFFGQARRLPNQSVSQMVVFPDAVIGQYFRHSP